MEYIKIKDFLNMEIRPFILGAFLSRTMTETIDGKSFFYAYTSFRSSKIIYRDEFDLVSYSKVLIDKLNKASGHYKWQVKYLNETSMELRFYILNDINMPKSMFFKTLYQKVMSSSWALDEELNEDKKKFIRGFMELRGSVDTTAKLIAQDYFYDNRLELKKAQILTDLMGLPIKYANFNARNLQPQYISGENKRNTQFRINILFYAKYIGFMNEYKALIFDRAYTSDGKELIDDIIYFNINMPKPKNDDITFIKYLNFFTNNIYEKELTKPAIEQLRKDLGFSNEQTENSNKRNMSIIALFSEISEDKCAVCGTTTTFINQKTGRNHFEIHHVISFCNGKEVDNIANLVKLCPTCHDMLKKNRASKETQIKAILKILHEHIEIFEFTSSYLGIDDINELASKIWEMLG